MPELIKEAMSLAFDGQDLELLIYLPFIIPRYNQSKNHLERDFIQFIFATIVYRKKYFRNTLDEILEMLEDHKNSYKNDLILAVMLARNMWESAKKYDFIYANEEEKKWLTTLVNKYHKIRSK